MQGFAIRLHQKSQNEQLACSILEIIQRLGCKVAENSHHSNFIIYDACEIPVEYINGKAVAAKTTYVITAHYIRHRIRSSDLIHIQVADTIAIAGNNDSVNELVDTLYSTLYSNAAHAHCSSGASVNPVIPNSISNSYFNISNTAGPILFVARDNGGLPSIEECVQLLSVIETQVTTADILAVVKCAVNKIESVTFSYDAGANSLAHEVTVPITPDKGVFSKYIVDAVQQVIVARDAMCVKLNFVFPKSIRSSDADFIRASLKELVTRYFVAARQRHDLSGVSIDVNFIFTGKLDTSHLGYNYTGSIEVTNSVECMANKFTNINVQELLALSFGVPINTPVHESNATYCIEKIIWVGDTDVPANVVMASKILHLTKDILTRHRPMTTHVFTFSNKSDGVYLEYHNTYSTTTAKNRLILNKALGDDLVLSTQLLQLVLASTINPIFYTETKRYYYSESIAD